MREERIGTMKKRRTARLCAAAVITGAMAIAFSGNALAAASGDVNSDSSFNLADAVAFSQYLSGQSSTLANPSAGDYDSNGRLNAVDLTLMKRTLLNPTSSSASDTYVTQITYASGSVTLKNANDEIVSAADAENVSVSNGTYVTITKPTSDGVTDYGDINVDGECANGQLKVDVDDVTYVNGQVTVNLRGLTLSNSSDSPIYVASVDDEFVLTVKKDTVNTISDGTAEYYNADESQGAIYSCDDMKIKGKGTLIVNGKYQDGIVCKDDLKIWNGLITVNAVDDGIRGKDSIRIGDPDETDYDSLSVTVNTEAGDGLKSSNDTEDKGYIRINGGTININSYSDGIQAPYFVEINGGTVDIYTFEGSNSTAFSNESGGMGGPGGQGGFGQGGFNPGSQGGSTETTNEMSAKGIKSNAENAADFDSYTARNATGTGERGRITINGGTVTIDSSDDGLHSSSLLTVAGGNIKIASGDDGVHSDATVSLGTRGGALNDFALEITKSYEGIEGYVINNYSGTTCVTSKDDGYNASAGSETYSVTSILINIEGGAIYVAASGDGVDSNGILNIAGGYTFVSQTGGGNAPLDRGDASGCGVTYSGGVVIAAGSTDMMSEGINGSQTCASSSCNVSAGGTIAVVNSSGTVLGAMALVNAGAGVTVYSPGGSSSDVVYSNPTISGQTTVISGSASNNMRGYTGGTASGGTQIANNYSGGGGFGR